MTHQQQWLVSCWPQASVLQPSIHHQVQSAIRQEKAQWEEFAQLMRVNEDLFPSCMAKVDNENKCVESEKLNSRMTDKLGDTDYKVQNLVSRSKDGDQCEEEHSFEKPHEEEAPAIKKEEAKISLTEWVKNIKLTSCPYVKEEPERSGSMEIIMLDGRLPRMANILFF